MNWNPFSHKKQANPVLSVLDQCAKDFTFPMLDNGYVYLAATRLALFRSRLAGPLSDWALVIEVFGFSPRAGHPDTSIHTFSSRLYNRNTEANYVSSVAYQNYLANNPHNEHRAVFAVDFESAQDSDDTELLAEGATDVTVRGQKVVIPPPATFAGVGIELVHPPRIRVFEMCRYLSETRRQQILATADEQRICIRPDMDRFMQLDEWHHPDLVSGELPSESQTFQQLAEVLVSGDPNRYQPSDSPNTHWKNWPDGGTL
jgi:hypothetical protein